MRSSPDTWSTVAAALLVAAFAREANAQETRSDASPDVLDVVASWIALDVTAGREALAGPALGALGFRAGPLGSYIVRHGQGSPRRVVACALDHGGYVVSGITGDGYLRLHNPSTGRVHPLWDQFHEGQRVRVRTARGYVAGVIAVRSTHLWRRRAADESPASIETFFVDVGARSQQDVAALGIAVLDGVARDWPEWRYADLVAGPHAGLRAGCAAVAAASRVVPTRGETIYVLAAEGSFDQAGLSAVLASLGTVDSLTVIDPVLAHADTGAAGEQLSRRTPTPEELPLPANSRVGRVSAIGIRTYYQGTLVESVSADDAAELFAQVARAAGQPTAPKAVSVETAPVAQPPRVGRDSLGEAATLLAALSDVYGVSEHEQYVRAAVLAALPAWARARATTDSIGNLIVAVGPAHDTVAFIAHLDEIGFEITRIERDGTVALRARGGFFRSLWEGQPALLHFDASNAPLPSCSLRMRAGSSPRSALGVFVPRATATVKQPAEVTAWFGVDSAALAACGVVPGMSLTSPKRAARLGSARFTARSIDDRAGSTALILAARALDPKVLDHAVLFVWSVQEETALGGAAYLASRSGTSIKRVHAVDTFVSADSPLESSRFALAPIGRGAVVRALDNSSATPTAEIDRVVRIARAAKIPLQVGTTNGGNDGSELARYGAVDVPVSWPLRYSHSPAELIDLHDVVSLSRLVLALAVSR
jgi:putative aminopeptidase FrvX